MKDAREILLQIADGFVKAEVPFMVVGSFFSNFYGIIRSTQDADFVIELSGKSIDDLARHLEADFKIDRQMSFETVTMTTRYNLVHRKSLFKIEIFLLKDEPHDQLRFSRRRKIVIDGHTLFYPTAEDVIIVKLRWSKDGKRTKDIDDVRNVVAVQTPAALDLAYIRHWTDQYGTRDIFETLLREASEL